MRSVLAIVYRGTDLNCLFWLALMSLHVSQIRAQLDFGSVSIRLQLHDSDSFLISSVTPPVLYLCPPLIPCPPYPTDMDSESVPLRLWAISYYNSRFQDIGRLVWQSLRPLLTSSASCLPTWFSEKTSLTQKLGTTISANFPTSFYLQAQEGALGY